VKYVPPDGSLAVRFYKILFQPGLRPGPHAPDPVVSWGGGCPLPFFPPP